MNEELIKSTTNGNNTSPTFAARASLYLIGLMAVLPFLQYHHTRPIPAFYTEYIAFILGTMALTLLLAGRYWKNIALPWITIAPLGLFAVMLLQMNLGMAVYYEIQVIALLYLLWAMLLIILGAVLRKEFGLSVISVVLGWSFLVGGELSALVGILQHFNIHSFLDDYIAAKNFAAVYGNVGQTNHFATHICLALASLVFLFAAARLPIWIVIPLALPLLLVLSLSGSRSSGIYLFAVLALSLILYWRGTACTEGYVAKRRLVLTSFLLITGFVITQWLLAQASIFVAPTGSITVVDRIFDQASGTSARFYLWQEAWHMFLQAPILGIGTGQFALHHFYLSMLYQSPEITGIYNNAHNLILHLMAETGLAGTLPVVGGGMLWLFGLYSVRRQSIDLSLWWLLAIVGIIAIHSLHEFPLWYGHFLGPTAFLLGVGETRFISMQLPHIGKLVTILILVIGWGVMVTMEQDYRQLESIMPTRDNQNKALTDSNRNILQGLHQRTLLSPYVDYALSSTMELNQEKLELKLKVNQRVMGFHPSAPVTYKHAVLLALSGKQKAAIEQAKNAALAYPNELTKFADSLMLLKIEYPELIEPLENWANRKIKEK